MPALRELGRRWRPTVRWTARLLWSSGRSSCLAMASTSLVAAVLAPVAVLVMGRIVQLIQQALDTTGGAADEFAADRAWQWILVAGSLALAGTCATAVRKYAQSRVHDNVSLTARTMTLQQVSQLDLYRLEDREVQNELAVLLREPGGILVRSVTESLNMTAAAIRVVGLATIMIVIEPWGTAVVLLAAAPLVAAGGFVSAARHRLRRRSSETQRWSRYYGRHLTNHQLAPAVRILGLADWMIDQVRNRIRRLQTDQRRLDRVELAVRVVTSTLTIVVLIAAVNRVAAQAASGAIELGRFVAFWVAAWRLSRDAGGLANSVSAASKAWLETEHLCQFLAPADEPPQPRNLAAAPRPGFQSVRGEIVVDRLSYRYPGAQRNALNDVSLRVVAGETVAIVGHNGAGKTTLAKLIAGLYEPVEGDIRYDGMSWQTIDWPQLHRQMAMVMQRPLCLEATAAENVALGDRNRLWDRPRDVQKLCAEVGIDEMLKQLPDGYETTLGKLFGRHELSGGQWQMLAVARALACRPSIVVLDEPTSGLDVYAEAQLVDCIQRLAAGRTTILISHRFTTLAAADRIVVLEQGSVVEQGSHEQLLASNGLYAAMRRAQLPEAA